ncbi:MAG: diguanylate cyclase, partial [Chloroflexota bacterium]
ERAMYPELVDPEWMKGEVTFAEDIDFEKVDLLGLAKRNAVIESVRENDKKIISAYLKYIAADKTAMYKIERGISVLPTWMAEFAMTGGLASLGDDAAVKAGEKILGHYAKTATGKLALRATGWGAGAATRSFGLSHKVGDKYVEQVRDEVLGLKEETGWATKLYRAWGDVYIESLSEEAGAGITKGGGWLLNKLPFGSKATDGLYKAWFAATGGEKGEFIRQMSTQAGYSNILGEIGEERLGTTLRAIADVDNFGTGENSTMLDRLKSGWVQDAENILVEIGVLATPMTGQFVAGRVVAREKIAKIRSELDVETQESIDRLQKEIAPTTTPAPAKTYEEGLAAGRERYGISAISGLPKAEILHEEFEKITKAADIEGQNTVVVAMDMANFKAVNDVLSEAEGDKVLGIVGHAIKNSIRGERGDVATSNIQPGHKGGDEFQLLLLNPDPAQVGGVIARIKDNINKALESAGYGQIVDTKGKVGKAGQSYPIFISAGHVTREAGGENNLSELLAQAVTEQKKDKAAMKAERGGAELRRGRVQEAPGATISTAPEAQAAQAGPQPTTIEEANYSDEVDNVTGQLITGRADPTKTSARQADIQEDRAALGLDGVPSPERKGWQTSLQQAKDNGHVDNALRTAAEINSKPRPLNDVETAGMVVRAAQLKAEHRGIQGKIKNATESSSIAILNTQLERIEAEFEALSTAIHKSGTEKGRALAAQKLTINQDYDLVSVVTRAKAKRGKKLTQKQHDKFEDLTSELERAQQEIERLQDEIAAATKPAEKGAGRYRNMNQTQIESERDSLVSQ